MPEDNPFSAGARRTAGDLELWPPQPARPRLRPRHRRIVVGRARAARRRRTQPNRARRQLRLADRHLRRRLFRQADRREQRAAGHRAAGALLGAVLGRALEPRGRDPAGHHRNLGRHAGRRDGGAAQPRRQLRAARAAPVAAPAWPHPRRAHRSERRALRADRRRRGHALPRRAAAWRDARGRQRSRYSDCPDRRPGVCWTRI